MTKRLVLSLLCAVLVLWITGCCPKNPKINTAATVHGNTDWHIDTAEEFLTGKTMGGTTLAANHCPNTWDTKHMHVGLTNTNHFYYDCDRTTPGDDTDDTNGIDRTMLLFYAGHGSPDSWDTLLNTATQGNMQLGDCPGGGLLRYYWQCSCEVFAHGAETCPGGGRSYACPSTFDGSADSEAMRNVYQRWGPVLSPALRMACGSSTLAWCWDDEVNRIWNNYNNLGYSVMSSFLYGMRLSYGVVPLCITMGGEDVYATPFFDSTFTNQPNTSGTTYYYIAYVEPLGSSRDARGSAVLSAKAEEIPAVLPVLALQPMELPAPLGDKELRDEGIYRVSKDEVAGRGARVRIDDRSGAVYLRGAEHSKSVAEPVSDLDLERATGRLIKSEGWDELGLLAPEGMRIMITREPTPGNTGEKTTVQSDVLFTYSRQVEVDGARIPVLGEGGKMSIELNNDGSLRNAAKVWRGIKEAPGKERIPVKTYDEAYREAMAQVEHADKYQLHSWRWGYWEEAGNVAQDEMSIVFVFELVPADHADIREFPPMRIKVAGQDL